jgi:hypothetical protein
MIIFNDARDYPPEPTECRDCRGTGLTEDGDICSSCLGAGIVEDNEPDWDNIRDERRDENS